MMKTYAKPVFEINHFESENIIMASGAGLTNGGDNGKPETASFNDLFGK